MGLLTLLKSEPTFAVTSSTSVNVSMLPEKKKKNLREEFQELRRGARRGLGGLSEIKEASFCVSTPRPSAPGALQHVGDHTAERPGWASLVAGPREPTWVPAALTSITQPKFKRLTGAQSRLHAGLIGLVAS